MGFFDSLKSLGRTLTGGGATVHVELGQANLNDPILVRVKARIADADIKIDNVYLLVRAREEVRVDKNGLVRSIGGSIQDVLADGRLDGVVHSQETCDFRLNISGPTTLKAGQEYAFEGEVRLPAGSRPSYRGVNCDHTWSIQAGLDAFGNDPDSGWVDFAVAQA